MTAQHDRAEEIVREAVKRSLQMALDFASPFCKAAVNQISREVVTELLIEGWKPPND